MKLTPITTFLVILTFLACSVLTCSPGSYSHSIAHNPDCYLCEPGYFCPGDGKRYACKPGSVSSYGASSCDACPSRRSNQDSTVCLFEDTPKDAFEIQDGHKFEVSANKINTFMTVYPQNSNNGIVQVTFVGKGGVKVYASLISGYPTPENSVSHASGLNATIEFNNRNQKHYTLVYFTFIITNSQVPILFNPIVFYNFGEEKIVSGKSLSLDFINCCDNQDRVNLVQFKKEFIPKGTLVNVQFLLLNYDDTDSYQLLFSTNPTLYQLNPNNADIQIQAKRNQLAQFTIKQSRDGPFVFSAVSHVLNIEGAINVTLSY